MNLNCVITDDEPIARGIIEDYVALVPGLKLVGKCQNALETIAVLRREQVDVLFLDIQMPEISGISFLKTLKFPPLVVFTTAYPEFALEFPAYVK